MDSIKIFTIFAGVNGAGKSTLFHIENNPHLGIRLNSDEVIKAKQWNWKEPQAQIKAGKEIIRLQQYCFENGLSFNQETTLCGSSVIKAIYKAQDLGYIINLRYVGVENVEIAKERVRRRTEQGGHGVSEDLIEKRFMMSRENLIKIHSLCDTVAIYDNSHDKIRLIANTINGNFIKLVSDCKWVNSLIDEIYRI